MSLPLNGCLGRAQLGAAELGQFLTGTSITGGIPLVFGGGTAQEEKKKKKKAKKPKKPKRVKVKASSFRRPEQVGSVLPPKQDQSVLVEFPPLDLTTPIREAIDDYQRELNEAEAKRKLQRQITEEDELLLLVI